MYSQIKVVLDLWNCCLLLHRSGEWSTAGCDVVDRYTIEDQAYVKCSCNHLTTFALIMDVSEQEVSLYI